jgi:hypothetical protein
MALGDGIRRNIASVDPAERALLRDAMLELNRRFFPGSRTDAVPGGVSLWFKQDEIHQATHVHGGPEFLPWHREVVNRYEEMLRQVNPLLSLHYWDWTQDPTNIPNANLGGGLTGTLNLFTPDFMGYGGSTPQPIGPPWQNATAPWRSDGFYVPDAANYRSTSPFDVVNNNPADPPRTVDRSVVGSPASTLGDTNIVNAGDYAIMRGLLESVHDAMHGFVRMGGQHISFRDPFVFLLHSNVDRLFARWQTDPAHPTRLDPTAVYGSESNLTVIVDGHPQNVNNNVEPWSTGHSHDQFDVEHFTRPWYAPENQGVPKTYKHPSVVFPPCYDTNFTAVPIVQVMNPGSPPVINFNDVPTGETTVRAAIFRIYGCTNVTVRVRAGAGPAAPFSILHPASGTVTVGHGSNLYVDARIWLAYTAGPALVPVPDGSVTFECPEKPGAEFTFVLKATAINRQRVAVMMALDQSWSMSFAAGTLGATRLEVLKDASRKFMELIQQDNGVGLIRFDHDSYAVNDPTFPGLGVSRIMSNNIFDPNRVAAVNAVNLHNANPAGNTSVGDGVDRARQILNALPAGDYDQKAMIVLTDGLENQPISIADAIAAGAVDNRTFAIGLGNEQQVNTVALRALANGSGGFLYLTGLLSSSIDDYFRLSKFFLQILAGVTNTSIIVDPSGAIAPGIEVRIPFYVSEADIDCTALVMTDENVVDFAIEAPDGTLIDPAMAAGLGITYGVGNQTKHYRFTLPVAIGTGQREGVWYAVLMVNKADFKRALSRLRDQNDQRPFQRFATHGARYSVVIQTYSNLKMAIQVEQSSFEPGAILTFQAALTEYDIPVEKRAQAQVELARPGGSVVILPMIETEPGKFEVETKATYAGVYHARILAKGVTLRGTAFTREQLASAAVWKGGDQPYQPPRSGDKDDWLRLLACLLSEENLSSELQERLKNAGIDLDGIRQCVKTFSRNVAFEQVYESQSESYSRKVSTKTKRRREK